MPENDLALSVDDLKGEIGHYLGYGRGAPFSEPAWTTTQLNNITAVLKSGLSQVYTPPPLSNSEPSHNWSFLRPMVQITVDAGTKECELPGDFYGFEGPLYVTTPSAITRHFAIRVTHIGTVQQWHSSQPDTTGAPRIACEKVLPGTGSDHSTRTNLYFWPTADSQYTILAEYKHLPGALTGSYPYPPGGAEHAELFKASVLAAAELQLDDQPGPRWQFFMQRLAASIFADRKRKGPFVGYNGDRSDCRRDPRLPGQFSRFFDNPAVTYNGSPL